MFDGVDQFVRRECIRVEAAAQMIDLVNDSPGQKGASLDEVTAPAQIQRGYRHLGRADHPSHSIWD